MRRALLFFATLLVAMAVQAQPERLFFDDFQHKDIASLRAFGWILRDAAGHPGVPGATWAPSAVTLVDDPSQRGNRLLRLSARTDGTPEGTVQAQACHQRKLLNGTYAARIRFTDGPVAGDDGDPVIQTFYAVSPLRFDYDPTFSELDWEYLPNGGWGSDKTRLYSIAWQTVRVEPWDAHNAVKESFANFAGWHVLVMQVSDGRSRWFVDGHEVAQHGGRNHPQVPMAISFNLWFSPGGLLSKSTVPREWVQEVDWVLHAADTVLSPMAVEGTVGRLRSRGRFAVDSVPAANPPLASECRF